jgi:hypothetical protein
VFLFLFDFYIFLFPVFCVFCSFGFIFLISKMSEFNSSLQKKKWGDYESEEEEEEVREEWDVSGELPVRKKGKERKGKQQSKVKEEMVEDKLNEGHLDEAKSEANEEDSDDDDDEDQLDLTRITIGNNQKKDEKKGSSVNSKNLSKREKLELKKKELEDLDSILAGFKPSDGNHECGGANIDKTETSENQAAKETEKEEVEPAGDKANKKKKKKKSGTKTDESNNQEVVHEESASSTNAVSLDSAVIPVDVASILKAKTSKKKGGSSAVVDPVKIAMEEAKKAAEAKKKKRDKSKFSEGSY